MAPPLGHLPSSRLCVAAELCTQNGPSSYLNSTPSGHAKSGTAIVSVCLAGVGSSFLVGRLVGILMCRSFLLLTCFKPVHSSSTGL